MDQGISSFAAFITNCFSGIVQITFLPTSVTNIYPPSNLSRHKKDCFWSINCGNTKVFSEKMGQTAIIICSLLLQVFLATETGTVNVKFPMFISSY